MKIQVIIACFFTFRSYFSFSGCFFLKIGRSFHSLQEARFACYRRRSLQDVRFTHNRTLALFATERSRCELQVACCSRWWMVFLGDFLFFNYLFCCLKIFLSYDYPTCILRLSYDYPTSILRVSYVYGRKIYKVRDF